MKTYKWTSNVAKLTAEIRKFTERDDGSIEIEGIASAPSRDCDGEIITREAMSAALPEFLNTFPSLRVMHQPVAAGTVTAATMDDEGRTIITATVVAEEPVRLVKAGVLRALSIGGKVERRNAADPSIIEALRLVEISLVDSPSHPEAVISTVKGEELAHRAALAAVEMVKGAQVAPADPERKPQEEHHRGECPDCGARLVCVSCSGATARKVDEVAKLSGLVDELRGGVARSLARVRKMEAERDQAFSKVAAVKAWASRIEKAATLKIAEAQGERDAANEELRRRGPKGAVRDVSRFAVEKADDVGGIAPEAEADDVRALIRKSHQRPSPLAADGGPFLRGRR